MRATTFKELVKVVRNYDNFTEYIDSYRQEMRARRRNAQLNRRFNELMQEDWPGYNRGVPYGMENNVVKKMFKWLWRADICVDDLDKVDPELYKTMMELIEDAES